ncbi:hypothetical protein Q3G72_018227 [Acer saccharum]|nr:hypothetical protein Q3G72_018227 [Acer saccharum]
MPLCCPSSRPPDLRMPLTSVVRVSLPLSRSSVQPPPMVRSGLGLAKRLRKIRKSWVRRWTSWVRLWTDDPTVVRIVGSVLRKDVDVDPEAYGAVSSLAANEETVPWLGEMVHSLATDVNVDWLLCGTCGILHVVHL